MMVGSSPVTSGSLGVGARDMFSIEMQVNKYDPLLFTRLRFADIPTYPDVLINELNAVAGDISFTRKRAKLSQ